MQRMPKGRCRMKRRLTYNYKDIFDTWDPIDVYDNDYSKINFQNVLRKLAHYEDLEEQGRLIELPCAVGDTVYDIADKKIRKQIVDGIEYMADGFFIYANEDEWLGRLGDLVFLTKAEAEAALKESEKECINLL